MAVPSSQDDGFREIQLSGKQLVFLFMAVTVVLVVTFLTGVLVGRGVRAERAETAQADSLTETPETPERLPSPVIDDPTKAAPPAPVEDGETGKGAPIEEQPPEAAPRTQPPASTPAAAAAKPAAAPAIEKPTIEKPAVAKTEPARPAPTPPVVPTKAVAAPAPGSGYAVQVAAVTARGEADAIVKRLSGKSYSAYVESPKGSTSVFRVRVGPYKTRREAQTIAEKLKKEEKFNPWVTR